MIFIDLESCASGSCVCVCVCESVYRFLCSEHALVSFLLLSVSLESYAFSAFLGFFLVSTLSLPTDNPLVSFLCLICLPHSLFSCI